MERIFRAMKEEIPVSKRIMELNPKHPLIEGLNKLLQANKDDENLRDYAEVLLDQALLAEGTPVSDTLKFSKNIAKLMVNAIK
jgi:molecular chaperone HtpG